jgi:nitrate/nitrite-specific signal transduction histidine kinase
MSRFCWQCESGSVEIAAELVLKNLRRKIWIDRFQTHLSIRIGLYCVLFQVAVLAVARIAMGLEAMQDSLGGWVSCFAWFGAIGMLGLLGFLFIRDAIRLAHRVVGPLVRFRAALKAVAAGEPLSLIRLRKGDYLQELKDDFNEMLKALEEQGAVVLVKPAQTQEVAEKTGQLASH